MPTLDWIGKDKVINHHLDVPYRVLERQYSYDENGQHTEDNGSENMIIHGDNLSALKSLLPQYGERIDCIYIDPPYNTGEEKWVYNDNVNDPRIIKWLGEVVGKEGEDLSRHDKWLCMMYPRLKLLQKLLANDGVIFISIGIDEVTSLKFLCNEIFGASNFLGMVVRRAKTTSFRGNYFAPRVDYILVYAKNKQAVKKFRDDVDASQYTKIETDGDRKGELYGDDTAFYLSTLETRPNQRYYIECPDGELVVPPGDTFPSTSEDGSKATPIDGDGVWRWEIEQYKLKKSYLSFKKTKSSPLLNSEGKKAKWNIYTKIYLNDKLNDANIPTELLLEYINRQGTKELDNLGLSFDFPKPSSLIAQLIKYLDRKKDIIVLDSFAGSGPTAQAVLNLNKSDKYNRKFILVEMMDYAESLTAERVKRVIKGYGTGKKSTKGVGGNFSYYELGDTIMNGDELNEAVGVEKICEYVYFTETKSRLALPKDDEPYYLGTHVATAYYFYYDRENVTTLSRSFLHTIKTKADSYVIYADLCTLSDAELEKYHITFKKIPRDITKL